LTGRDLDPESDLYHYRARYYDSATGQFISADPIGFAAGDGNLYRYVGNAPTNATDPSGMESRAVESTQEVLTMLKEHLKQGVFMAFRNPRSGTEPVAEQLGAPTMRPTRQRVAKDFSSIVRFAGDNLAVLEIKGHAGGRESIISGESKELFGRTGTGTRVTRENAAEFAEELRSKVLLKGRKGVILLMSCKLGSYISDDKPGKPTSVAQIIANSTGWIVVTPDGYFGGSWAFYMGDCVLESPMMVDKYPDGKAYEKWWITTPE
jgi:RHS repeat-associated protein